MAKSQGEIFKGYVSWRIRQNKNFLCAITGPTGSGKTYSALRLAEGLDPEFSADRIVFTVEKFLELLNSGTLKSGAVIVFEEAGVSMNNRSWQSLANNVIQYILQTFRHENYIVIFTAPHFGFIDKASTKLFHCYMETCGIDFAAKLCNLKPFMLQISQRTGDVFYKYLSVKMPGEPRKKLKLLRVRLPSEKLMQEYEIRKKAFTSKLNQDLEDKINKKEKIVTKSAPSDTYRRISSEEASELVREFMKNG